MTQDVAEARADLLAREAGRCRWCPRCRQARSRASARTATWAAGPRWWPACFESCAASGAASASAATRTIAFQAVNRTRGIRSVAPRRGDRPGVRGERFEDNRKIFTWSTISRSPRSTESAAPWPTTGAEVLLIVNVASHCGFTPQYAGLEALYRRYQDRGFCVLGFPCDQFGHQEPGDEAEIRQFCSREVRRDLSALRQDRGQRPGRRSALDLSQAGRHGACSAAALSSGTSPSSWSAGTEKCCDVTLLPTPRSGSARTWRRCWIKGSCWTLGWLGVALPSGSTPDFPPHTPGESPSRERHAIASPSPGRSDDGQVSQSRFQP